jgi:hypothetical protein
LDSGVAVFLAERGRRTDLVHHLYIPAGSVRIQLTSSPDCQMAGHAGGISFQTGEVIIIQHIGDPDESLLIQSLSRGERDRVFGRLVAITTSFVESTEWCDDLVTRLAEPSWQLQTQDLIVSKEDISIRGRSIGTANLGIVGILSILEKINRPQRTVVSRMIYVCCLYAC